MVREQPPKEERRGSGGNKGGGAAFTDWGQIHLNYNYNYFLHRKLGLKKRVHLIIGSLNQKPPRLRSRKAPSGCSCRDERPARRAQTLARSSTPQMLIRPRRSSRPAPLRRGLAGGGSIHADGVPCPPSRPRPPPSSRRRPQASKRALWTPSV